MPIPFAYDEYQTPSDSVEAMWSFVRPPVSSDSLSLVILPDACLDLIFRLHRDAAGDVLEGSLLIAGPAEQSMVVEAPAGVSFVGARFRPGWGGAALGVDPKGLVAKVVDAAEVSPVFRRLLGDLISISASSLGMTTHVLRAAAERMGATVGDCTPALAAVRLMRVSGGRLPAREVATLIDISPRTLRREMGRTVGLTPKAVSRVFRFRRSLQLRKADRSLSLAALAHEAGYADQAHMTREFRRLGGFSPTRFPPFLLS